MKAIVTKTLLRNIKSQIDTARKQLAVSVNQRLTLLYWKIGQTIDSYILNKSRAAYGNEIIATVSRELSSQYGNGYSVSALWRMVQFSKQFTNEKILATLSRELSWSHFIELIAIENATQRTFYVKFCIAEKWSVRLLRDRIDSMLFERTVLSKKPAKVALRERKHRKDDVVTRPDLVFRDPYFLDFLDLKDTYSEKDLENAILVQLQRFITELGSDFAFLARQKRITIDRQDYKIDLLFYHRGLKCLVAIDLKLGKFRASDKGQMELYLRWLEKYEMREGEIAPIGLILCSDKSDEHVELLLSKENRIKVAQYYTKLPSMNILKQKLHKATMIASGSVRALPASKRNGKRAMMKK